MNDDQNLVNLVTRGLASIQEQLREREGRISGLSEKIVGMEFQLAQVNKTMSKLENDLTKAETTKLEMRVSQLEEQAKEVKSKQIDNAKWIKGLLASVIILLLGFLFNFVRISLN